MPVQATGISLKERNFIETYLQPVAVFENLHGLNVREFQRNILLDPSRFIAVDCARAVGKTTVLVSDIIRTILTNPNKEGLLTTPSNAHIAPTWDKIIVLLYNKLNLEDSIIRKVRSPDYLLSFKNGFILHGRIAGASAGKSLLSLHVDFVWIDEGQLYFPEETLQLQGCLNSDYRLKIFGVPNGIRKSYLYKCSTDPEFSHYNVDKFAIETYTQTDDDRQAMILGGRTSQGYQNQILGVWGLPQATTFPEKWWGNCLELNGNYKIFNFNEKELNIDFDSLILPQFDIEPESIKITADIGFSPDPTVIGLHYLYDNCWHLLCKFVLRSIDPDIQAKFMDWLAMNYNVKLIALDVGNIGKAVYLELIKTPRKYEVIGVNFGGNVVIGLDKDDKEIKERIKYYSTVKLNEWFKGRKIAIPTNDEVMQDELRNSTQNVTGHGNQVYSGVDHNLDMLRILPITELLEAQMANDGGPGVAFSDF